MLETAKPLLCPGVPADVPPKIEDYLVADDEETGDTRKRTIRFGDEATKDASEEVGEASEESSGGPSSVQKKMLAMAGQDIDTFMQEMEVSCDWLLTLLRLDSDFLISITTKCLALIG